MLAMDHVEAPYLRDLALRRGDTVVVAGAYKGDTVEFIVEYHPGVIVHAYEPQKWALDKIIAHADVVKHPFGLGLDDCRVTLYEYETDACTIIPRSDSRAEGEGMLMRADAEFARLAPIALFVCNMEGYEYMLLRHVSLKSIRRLLVQLHTVPGASKVLGVAAEATRTRLAANYDTVIELGKGWYAYE